VIDVKIRTILLLLLGVFILLIAVGMFALGTKRWAVARKLAAIRNSGAPVSFNELLAAQPPASANDAASHLASVSESANRLFGELEPILYTEDGFDRQIQLDDAPRSMVEAAYAKYPDVLPAWKRATESSYYRWRIRSSAPAVFRQDTLDALGDVRLHNRLAVCRARYLASCGLGDEAVEACLAQFQLLDIQDSGFGLVHSLTTIACRGELVRTIDAVLRNLSLFDDTHAAIETTLARQDSLPGFAHGLQTERVVGIESFQTMPITIRWFSDGLIDYLKLMESEIATGTQSAWQSPAITPVVAPGILSSVVPAIENARESMNRLRGEMRRLRILNAMAKRGSKLDEATQTEVDLSQLDLPADATIDPFSGNPIYQADVPDSPL